MNIKLFGLKLKTAQSPRWHVAIRKLRVQWWPNELGRLKLEIGWW